MSRDVYRTSQTPEGTRAKRELVVEELVIPALALVLGAVLICISFWDGVPRTTEGGLGTLALLFGAYALREALRSRPQAS